MTTAPKDAETLIIICEPRNDCADPHIYRWHCMRGFDLDDKPAVPDVCPLKVCERRGANRGPLQERS